ncbi:hypothetical protein [Sphingomonas prati]|uniref:PH domain-containing protein n=1 Tax=Sphingomonas prati TaxID=1843237 RepID=A0A7W9F3B0_9SPHN|nr:hypothetical protein [Sphingomonas prati]MBB5729664.1 hypothetical protein [Sphingomonas prati]
MFGFSFVMSVLSQIEAAGILVLMAGGVAWFCYAWRKRARRHVDLPSSPHMRTPRAAGETGALSTGRYDLSVAEVGRRVARLALFAVLLFLMASTVSAMAPLWLLGIVVFALAILTVARLFGDRTMLRFDDRTLTVRGLLGEATMRWDDVGDMVIRKASFLSLPTLFSSGTRRNIQVTARINRLGGPERLLIPYPLLGIGEDGLVELYETLTTVLAGGSPPAVVSGTADVAPTAPNARGDDTASTPFDPDGSISRYLAGRDQATLIPRQEVTSTSRPMFGRKTIRH